MRKDSKDRYCKKCGADWLGDEIPMDSLYLYNGPSQFKRYDNMDNNQRFEEFEKDMRSGVFDDDPRITTHFSRRIGVYDLERDGTLAFMCPDCNDEVKR